MKMPTMRMIVRWIHLALTIPIIGYIYSPFRVLPDYAAPTRYVFLPTMLLTGLWMWKGHLLRRLVVRRAE
ncbi:MAG: hypothetical protein JF628_07210 [Sphingomonas sp.]|nr:hypothetical protein [Sphingomonas sp.]